MFKVWWNIQTIIKESITIYFYETYTITSSYSSIGQTQICFSTLPLAYRLDLLFLPFEYLLLYVPVSKENKCSHFLIFLCVSTCFFFPPFLCFFPLEEDGDMLARYGQRCEEILTNNENVDNLAGEALKMVTGIGCLANSSKRKWLVCLREGKEVTDSMQIFKENITKRNETLHSIKYSDCLTWKLDSSNVDSTANEKLMKSIKYSYRLSQMFRFKIGHNKMKTKVAYKGNSQMQRSIRETTRDKYEEELCPFGDDTEDITHLIRCPRTMTRMKNVPRRILKIINNARKDSRPHLRFFPNFYWAWDNRQIVNMSKALNKIQEVDPLIALSGTIPRHLREALAEGQINSKMYGEDSDSDYGSVQ